MLYFLSPLCIHPLLLATHIVMRFLLSLFPPPHTSVYEGLIRKAELVLAAE